MYFLERSIFGYFGLSTMIPSDRKPYHLQTTDPLHPPQGFLSRNGFASQDVLRRISPALSLTRDRSAPKERKFSQCERAQHLDQDQDQLLQDQNELEYFARQLAANSPCEDTLIYSRLKSVNGLAFSIFDGHGGDSASGFCEIRVHELLDMHLQQGIKTKLLRKITEIIRQALKATYLALEEEFYPIYKAKQIYLRNKSLGTCGITAVLWQNKLIVANAGDSQGIIISLHDQNYRQRQTNCRLTTSSQSERARLHNQFPNDPTILARSKKGAYYVKGKLQPTRTIGDYALKRKDCYDGSDQFKGPYITCVPDINEFEITSSDLYLVLGSDGVWDFLTKWDVVRIVIENKNGDPTSSIIEEVLARSAQKHGKTVQEIRSLPVDIRRSYYDDISVIVVPLEGQDSESRTTCTNSSRGGL